MQVKVEWFKESGKWYSTQKIDIPDWIVDKEDAGNFYEIRLYVEKEIKDNPKMDEMTAVCMDEEIGFPMMVKEKNEI